jgi:glycerol uptake facilitator-like aquaporin
LNLETAGIFAAYPTKNLSLLGGFFDQLLATSLLVILVLAVSDKRNEQLSHASIAFLVGGTILAIGTGFAYNCGYPINPARDLGPRLFTLIAGFGTETFTSGNYFFWVPIFGPMVGALFGVLVYSTLISNNW